MLPSKIRIPRVPSQPLKRQLLLHLRTVWAIASTNNNALNELRIALMEDPNHEPIEHRLLIRTIVSLQPATLPPIDGYTFELVQSLWDIAVIAPDCVEQKARGVPAYNEPLMALDWCIWMIERNASFRTQSASSIPIAKLPVEVLSLVFQKLRKASPSFPTIHGNITCHLLARLVCKDWYEVMNDTASVWAFMNMGLGVAWTKRALRMSRNVEIDVHAHATLLDHSLMASALLCMSELHHIRELGFSCSWITLQVVTTLLTSCEAPRLRSLVLKPNDHEEPESFHVGRLSTDLFLGQAPSNLCMIILENYIISPACPIFGSSLVHIELVCCRVWSNADALLDTLQLLPALETFHWLMPGNVVTRIRSADMRFPQYGFLSARNRIVSLPRLKELLLEWPLACFTTLMERLNIPPACTVRFHDDYTFSGEKIHDDAVLQSACRHLDATMGAHLARSPGGFKSLHILQCSEIDPGHGSLVIEGRRSAPSPTSFTITFIVSDLTRPSVGVETMRSLFRHLLAWPALRDSVTRVLTNHEAMSSDGLWVAVLDSLPSISRVEIENSADSDASSALNGLAGAILQRQDLVPELSDVALSHIELDSQVQQRLAAAIELRQSVGCPPLRLILELSEQQEDIIVLEQVVAKCGGKIEVMAAYAETV